MSETIYAAEAPRRRGAPKGHGRFPRVPPPPRWVRSEWEILDEQGGALGLTLWQSLRDVLLWHETREADRRGLFRPLHASRQDRLARSFAAAPELGDALRDLSLLTAAPGTADVGRAAAACEAVWMWAEAAGKHGTAIQFAEAAAKLEPKSSRRSFSAGRLCRIAADHERAAIWFRRAVRLAGRARPIAHLDIAFAHLGWGHSEHDRGHLREAVRHFLCARSAALRNGQKSLAGVAHHYLIGVYVDADQFHKAVQHAEMAMNQYPAKYHRLPALANDVAFLWLKSGHHSTAMYLFAKALPWITRPVERGLALAGFARAAAASRDRVRFERLVVEFLSAIAGVEEGRETALYNVAEGARSFEQWDRAERLATEALTWAVERGNCVVVSLAQRLLADIGQRATGDVDVVPPEGCHVDRITSVLLQRLRKLPAPGYTHPGTVLFPERYPLD